MRQQTTVTVAPPRFIRYLSTAEAEQRWCKGKGVVRVDCNRGRFNRFFEEGLVQKAGGRWLISEEAMQQVYGEPKTKGGKESE